ncbi:MAG TPA: bifunctional (p)ppGpp synthetase/guanosine-3',5'-bis(diphosphate) 3'-pyrophosphohydrolase [Usitatibacteraceae bacterium]|nr:bifunctional (p)ppGpp synthetase/guanosine-3',5'-bis(diphosphate) 3'-pyrophosphohydrolase [Usitatibacteraceae bacterium]
MITEQSGADVAQLEAGLVTAFGAPLADSPLRALQLARGACQAAGRDAAFARTVSVARLLLVQGADPETVAAALINGAIPEGELDPDGIQAAFGPELVALLKGLGRAGRIEALATAGSDPEQLRKMLLAIAEDVRVVLIKLAERVVHMRSLTKADDALRRAAGEETLALFAPLANRLGVSELKWELEDFAFRFTEPDLYRNIAGLLDEKRNDREAYIARVVAKLSEELAGMGIEATIHGRPKHLYSIFRKMHGKNLAFERLYDIRAVRVIVKNVRECYAVLGVVHDLWTPVEGEFDDYIASPKANDYKSLHTAVVGPEGRTLEVQIRTDEMHQHSEHGVAAHWRYKEGRRADQKFDAKIAWLRQVLAWKADVLAGEGAADRVPRGLFEETIYVLTPQGRVVDLPAGSTPVDFAYHVHTDLGHRCRGARVDGQMVPLTTKLANAQRVEIIAAKQGGPSRDWLSGNYLTSPRALAKVRQWFRHEDFAADVATGRGALEKELTRLGATSFAHDRIAVSCGFARTEDFFAALGRGEITGRQIEIAVRGEVPVEPPPAVTVKAAPASRASSGVLVLGVNNIATLVAKCCKPVPPDPIIGFITRTRGVMVHRLDCPNVTGLEPAQRERLLPADWGKTGESGFSADIEVVALDRQGLLRDISEAISRERINVTAVNTLSRGAHAFMRFTLQVDGGDAIHRVLRQVRDVHGVDQARRL